MHACDAVVCLYGAFSANADSRQFVPCCHDLCLHAVCRNSKVQLLSRHWIIQDDKGRVVDEIRGPGDCKSSTPGSYLPASVLQFAHLHKLLVAPMMRAS